MLKAQGNTRCNAGETTEQTKGREEAQPSIHLKQDEVHPVAIVNRKTFPTGR